MTAPRRTGQGPGGVGRCWRLATSQLISVLVHLVVIIPAGAFWDSAQPEKSLEPEEAPVEIVALTDARWETNRSSEEERLVAAESRVGEETTARRRRSGRKPVRVPGKRGVPATVVSAAVVRSSVATTGAMPDGAAAGSIPGEASRVIGTGRVVRPAELGVQREAAPTYDTVAAQPLPPVASRRSAREVRVPRERVAGLPVFGALAAAHPEMDSMPEMAPVFVLRGRRRAAAESEGKRRNAESEHESSTLEMKVAAGDPRASTLSLGGGGGDDGAREDSETRTAAERNLLYAYLLRVRDAVQPLWMPIPIVRAALRRPHDRLRSDHVELRIRLQLDGEGRVRRADLARSSGIPALDHHALEAVARAAPFLPPPARLLDDSGILGFTYGARTYLTRGGAGGP